MSESAARWGRAKQDSDNERSGVAKQKEVARRSESIPIDRLLMLNHRQWQMQCWVVRERGTDSDSQTQTQTPTPRDRHTYCCCCECANGAVAFIDEVIKRRQKASRVLLVGL